MTHLIEAFLVPSEHPFCDGIALEGMRLVALGLLPSYRCALNQEGGSTQHLRARRQMLNAAMMGATAFQKGLGLIHSSAHALSAVCDLHHGLANALMLLPGLRFNRPFALEKFTRMEAAVRSGGADCTDLISWVDTLLAQLQLPRRLSDVGVKAEQIPTLSQYAFADACHQSNPAPVRQSDFQELFHKAL